MILCLIYNCDTKVAATRGMLATARQEGGSERRLRTTKWSRLPSIHAAIHDSCNRRSHVFGTRVVVACDACLRVDARTEALSVVDNALHLFDDVYNVPMECTSSVAPLGFK